MRKLNLKSLACYITGIALIAIVFPVAPIQYVLAQSGTQENFYCKRTLVTLPLIDPPTVACDRTTEKCANYRFYYPNYTGECIPTPAEANSCNYWTDYSFVRFPIVYEESFLSAWHLGLIAAGAAGWACDTFNSILPKNFIVIKIAKNYNATGLIITFTCAGFMFVVTDAALNACDFGKCKEDQSKPPMLGPNCIKC